jgi:hypothetical protein
VAKVISLARVSRAQNAKAAADQALVAIEVAIGLKGG